jgi:fructose/tagatose bisphosphate aldolase
VDALGVSIGNVEVLREGTASLDLALLEKIHEAISIPLVLHGGSGIPDDTVPDLIARGVSKINLGAALNAAFLSGMRLSIERSAARSSPKYTIGSGWDIDCLASGELAMKALVKRKMSVYGSAGRL